MYPIYFFLLAIIGAVIQILGWHTPIIETFLLYILIFNCGLQGIFAFVGHFFMADDTANKIGWPAGNLFQMEIAFTNLSFGILGILCIWFRGNFWTAVIIGRSIFWLGAAYTHIFDIKKRGNLKKYNAGPILYADILLPIILVVLLILIN